MLWKKPSNISPLSPEPCPGVCTGDRQVLGNTKKVNLFVPWLPGSAGSKNKANTLVALSRDLADVNMCLSINLTGLWVRFL